MKFFRENDQFYIRKYDGYGFPEQRKTVKNFLAFWPRGITGASLFAHFKSRPFPYTIRLEPQTLQNFCRISREKLEKILQTF